jgi:hypothetical protein
MSQESSDQRSGINRHFKREGRIMVWAAVGVPIVLVVGLWLLSPYILPVLSR